VAALGLLAGGDLGSGMFSIGGEDSRVPNTFGPEFPALGISRHGFFEGDNSITREGKRNEWNSIRAFPL
jgi:hypothetical protein